MLPSNIKTHFSKGCIVVFMIGVLGLTACSLNNSAQKINKSSKLVVKTSTVQSTKTTISSSQNITLPSGILRVDNASLSLSEIRVQENTGQTGQNGVQNSNQSDVQTSGNDGSVAGETSNATSESDSQDIVAKGPFSVNIMQPSVSLASVAIYPGTFKKADLLFQTQSKSPYNGHSLIISGVYKSNSGSTVPFSIQSDYNQVVEVPLAGNGIQVKSNSVVTIVARFDLSKWLGGLNWNNAVVTGGKIVVNSSSNQNMLTKFEQNLSSGTDIQQEQN